MTNQEAVRYARELYKRGFTRDAARGIMLSRGYNIKDVDEALRIGLKPESHININWLIGIAIALIIILIPTIILLTKDSSNTSSTNNFQQTTTNNKQNQPQEETFTYECVINEECSYNEICQNGNCVILSCNSCEQLINHECTPLNCNDNNTCTIDHCSESACFNDEITSCKNNDGCCPSGCNETLDNDCFIPIESCKTDLDCSDGDFNTIDTCIITNETSTCQNLIPSCGVDDGVCPSNCTTLTDNDCNAYCGNNMTESGENCDGNCPSTPSDCNDNNTCTIDTLLGSSSQCTAECTYNNIIICAPNDSCCPTGCTYSIDTDCPPNSTLVASGAFTSVQRPTTGNVELYSYESGTYKVKFSSQFTIVNTELHPNLKVYLASKSIVNSPADLNEGNIELGQLKATSGQQEYEITTFISDIETYKSIVIYHEAYNGVYAYAKLTY